MTTIAQDPGLVIGGVDTHKDTHVAAALDGLGRLLGTASFPTTRNGYRRLLTWLQSHVIEVNRPNRQDRRRRGKSDTIDAEQAARAVLAGTASATPRSGTGPVEAIRQLRVARAGAMKARTAAANQIHSLCDTAADSIQSELHGLSIPKRVAVAERWRPVTSGIPETAAKRAIASVARCWRALDDEARALQAHLKKILDELAPALLAVHAAGYDALRSYSSLPATTLNASATSAASPLFAASLPSPRRQGGPMAATDSTEVATDTPTPRFGEP